MIRLPNKYWCVTLLAIALVASACSGSADDVEQSADAPGRTTAADDAGASAFPVTIDHRHGRTSIDDEPTRVVTLGLTDQDAVLALGLVPVGTAEWFGEQPGAIWPWATEALGDAAVPEIVNSADGPDLERVAGLRPDLILAVYAGLTREQYDQLSQIAPVVAQPEEFIDFGVPWDEQTRIIGQALGRTEAAEALVADVEDQVAETRRAHPEFDGATATVATVYDGKLSVYAPQDARGRFLTSLGFELPAELGTLAGEGFSADVSMERVDLIDGDAVVWLVNDRETDIAKFEAEALYAGLDVHTEGRDVFVEMLEPVGAALSFVTPLSIPLLLDELVPQLSDAVDGDPAT